MDTKIKDKDTFTWQQYLDVTGLLCVLADRQGHIVQANNSFRDLVGLGQHRVAKPWWMLFVPPFAQLTAEQAFDSVWQAAPSAKDPILVELPIVSVSREQLSVLWRCTISDGFLILLGEMVTPRQRMAEEHASLLQRFRALFTTAPDAIAFMDTEGVLLEVNQAFVQLSGYSRDQLLDSFRYKMLFTAGQQSEVVLRLAEVSRSGLAAESEAYWQVASDSLVPIIMTVSAITNAAHVTTALVVTVKDISHLKNTQQQLIERSHELELSRARLEQEKAKAEAIVASMGEAVIVADRAGLVVLVNQYAEQLFEMRAADIHGKSLVSVFPLQDQAGKATVSTDTFLHPQELAAQIQPRQGTYYFIKRDSTKLPLAVTVSPVMLGDNYVGTVVICRDVTKEQAVDRAKSEFVSIASHQLRTPLTIIKWYADKLLQKNQKLDPVDAQELIKEIYDTNHRMIVLVNALLSVSRLELGTLGIQPQLSDIVDVAHRAIAEHHEEMVRKNLKVNISIAEPLPLVMIDPQLMLVVLQNLISNAVKYTPEKGTLSVTITTQPGALVCKVADTGCGIPRDQQSRIFSKFFRADNVRELDTGGTGLGLYITKALVKEMNGMIWFESESGKGTTFYVSLPLSGMQERAGIRNVT